MFVYIKFLEGPVINKFFKVSSSKFKNNLTFDSNLNLKIKYQVQHKDGKYYKAQIVCFDSSEKKLDEKIMKRPKGLMPAKNLDTASDDCGDETPKGKSALKQPEKKIDKYLSLSCVNQSSKLPEETATMTKAKTGLNQSAKVTEIENHASVANVDESNESLTLSESAKSLSEKNLPLLDNAKTPPKKKLKNEVANKMANFTESSLKMSKDKDLEVTKKKIDEIKSSSSKTSQSSTINKRDDANKKLIIEYDKLKIKYATAEKTIQELRQKTKKLEKKVESYKKKAEQANEESRKLQELNNKLVTKVIEKFEEKQVTRS